MALLALNGLENKEMALTGGSCQKTPQKNDVDASEGSAVSAFFFCVGMTQTCATEIRVEETQ